MTEYTICVSCTEKPSGIVGTFIAGKGMRTAISPIFPSLAELFHWMRDNEWKRAEYPDGVFVPWRVEKIGV